MTHPQPTRIWTHRPHSKALTPLGDALQVFYGRLQKGESRIGLLKDYADIIVSREHAYKDTRRGRYAKPTGTACWACQTQHDALTVHHIIQVQHGGKNVLKNLVLVCRACHARIHPWLTKAPTPAVVTFDPTPRLNRHPR